jgi:hypothetical protein
MRTIWFSLAWKEWHEHKWKLVSIVAILCGVAALIMGFAETEDTFGVAVSLVGICIVPLAMFIGLGAAANERSRNTLPFLQSLPAPLWRVALTKGVLGLVTLFLSIIFAVAFIYAWIFLAELAGQKTGLAVRQIDISGLTGLWYVDCVILLAPLVASIFAWCAAAGVNRRDEISAGAVAVAIFVGWVTLLTLVYSVVGYWIDHLHLQSFADRWKWLGIMGLTTFPGGLFAAINLSNHQPTIPLALCYTTAAITNVLLLVWYVRRFGKLANLEIHSPKSAVRQSTRTEWLPPPRQFATTAIAWKQFRESGPIALAGVAGSVGITLALVIVNIVEGTRPIKNIISDAYQMTAIFFGFLVALVVGIGVCLNDVSPKINEFWRSRPIQVDLWFWIKFATGLIVVFVSTYAPIALLVALKLPVIDGNFSEALLVPAMQLAVYAAAVATTCLVRQAVYAAILSIAVVYLGVFSGLAICTLPRWLHEGAMRFSLLFTPTPAELAFGIAISFTVSTILAWLAVRYDWGKKSRY